MGDYSDFNLRMKAMEQLGQEEPRFIDPSDIYVPLVMLWRILYRAWMVLLIWYLRMMEIF